MKHILKKIKEKKKEKQTNILMQTFQESNSCLAHSLLHNWLLLSSHEQQKSWNRVTTIGPQIHEMASKEEAFPCTP